MFLDAYVRFYYSIRFEQALVRGNEENVERAAILVVVSLSVDGPRLDKLLALVVVVSLT